MSLIWQEELLKNFDIVALKVSLHPNLVNLKISIIRLPPHPTCNQIFADEGVKLCEERPLTEKTEDVDGVAEEAIEAV